MKDLMAQRTKKIREEAHHHVIWNRYLLAA